MSIECSPKIVPEGKTSRLTIRFGKENFPESGIRFRRVGASGLLLDGHLPGVRMNNGTVSEHPDYSQSDRYEPDAGTGCLSVMFHFDGEGEHCLIVDRWNSNTQEFIFWEKFTVYALKADLLPLRPFRGDFHLHSSYSKCNKDRATPVSFGIENRRLGCDFMCVSDHKQYAPSLEAMAFFKTLPTRFHSYPGEEIHLSDYHNLHIGLFGAEHGISDRIVRGNDSFECEMDSRLHRLETRETDSELRYLMAASDLIFDAVHDAGGIAVLNHPYWRPLDRFFLPEAVLNYILEQGKFDAVELIGQVGSSPLARETNLLAVAMWQRESLRRGKLLPPLGSTDAHAISDLGNNCSIVFAEKNEFSALADSIRAGHCLACERNPGEFPHLYGDFRLVQYAYFLLRNYFPAHDLFCKTEATILESYYKTCDASLLPALKACAEEQDSFDLQFFSTKDFPYQKNQEE